MSSRPIHILHLTAHWLRWVTLEPGAVQPIKEIGSALGDPARTLDDWARKWNDSRATIRLYDGRPRYLTFEQRIPQRALAQKNSLVEVRLRQELGLGPDALYYAAGAEPSDDAPGQADLSTVVARREALADVREWQERHELASLWVGADICAVRALLRLTAPTKSTNGSSAPTIIVCADAAQATLYQQDGGQQILKAVVHAPGRLADLGWKTPSARAHFGAGAAGTNAAGDALARNMAGLDSIPEVPSSAWEIYFPGMAGRIQELDPVLLGGIIEARSAPATASHVAMPSLLPSTGSTMGTRRFVERFHVQQLATVATLCAVALGLSLWGLHAVKASAISRLTQRNEELKPELTINRSQAAVLQRIKTERKPTIPIFQAVLEATPQGVTFDRMQLGESGTLQISASGQSPDAANQLVKDLGKSPLFDSVKLDDQRSDTRGRGQVFNVTAHVKGWGR